MHFIFLRATAGTAKRLLAIVILSVRVSVRHDLVLIQARVRWIIPAMLNYACEAGEAGDGNTAAFTAGGAAKMTRAVR